jgi:DNA-binding transcriptional MerR regulator
MFCASCGSQVQDGSHFCPSCGASLQAPGGVGYRQQPSQAMPKFEPEMPQRRQGQGRGQGQAQRQAKPKDPYQLQIKQLRLQIKQLKLDLQQINQQMGKTRAQYEQGIGPLIGGWGRRIERGIEDAQLWGPQKQKQQLQQQIQQLEQQLLSLQQAQAQWQMQQQG